MIKKNVWLVMVISIILTGAAFASDSLYIVKTKSPTTGVLISIGATLAPAGIGFLMDNSKFHYIGAYLMAFSPAFGPSAGHFYAHQWGSGCLGIGSRFVLAGATMWFAAPYFRMEQWNISSTILWIGAGLIALESIIEISSVPGSVRKYNGSLIMKNQINLSPQIDFRSRSYGLKLNYSF